MPLSHEDFTVAAWLGMARPLQALLEPLCPGIHVDCVDTLASTNTALLERARRGQPGAALLAARCQTAGRGRQGRSWWSEPDASLTFSLALPLERTDWSGLSLAAGLAVAEALAPEIGLELGLKWPNDLWLRAPETPESVGRKLGGLLIETVAVAGVSSPARVAVVGVGLNVRDLGHPIDPQRYSSGRAYLQERLPSVDALTVLQRVAPALLVGLQRFAHEGFAPLRARYAARDVLAGREIQAGAMHGRAAGVNDLGLLLVHTESGVQAISSGEVSVRPC
jgi:BirA family transcriptional regulator, biotin operon repressor / biotin---[acetyl-CoA-carboxylase] ligase